MSTGPVIAGSRRTRFQGCWAVVLRASLGRRDVVFGTTVSRRRPELDGYDAMVGLFISPVPVVVRPDPHGSLGDLFAQLRHDQQEIEPHNDFGLAEMQSASGRTSLFDRVLVFENYPLDLSEVTESFAGLRIDRFQGRGSTHYPLAVVVLPGTGIRFDHDPDALPTETVRRLAARLAALLERLPDIVDIPLAAVSVLTDAERTQLLGTRCCAPRIPRSESSWRARRFWEVVEQVVLEIEGVEAPVEDLTTFDGGPGSVDTLLLDFVRRPFRPCPAGGRLDCACGP